MTAPLLARADAELYVRSMGAGRSQPLLLSARRDDGVLIECVVKPSARLVSPPTEYLFEWIGAAIGRALGVNVPAPLAVEVSAAFARSVEDAGVRPVLGQSLGLAFGSTYEKGYTQIPKGFALSAPLREEAARVVAFDVFIHNVDRRTVNANLFVQRDQFLAFDHEQGFSFLLAILGGDPALDDGADIVRQHVLPPHIGDDVPSLDDFAGRLALLDDAFFDALVAATPAEWTRGAALGKIDRVTDVLRRRRDAAATWLPRLHARMSK